MSGEMSHMDPNYVPPAMPAQALPYSVPGTYARPGIITAIGVMCIVVACLSGLGSLISGMYGFGFWVMSRVTASMAATTATSATVSGGSGSSGSQALPPGDAAAAVNEMTKTLSLDGQHVRELDKLLRLHGREVFGVEEDQSVSAGTVRSALTGHGTNPATGAVYFTTAQGRVDIFRNRATFVSADGVTHIDTSARNNSESIQQSTSATATSGTPGTTLTPAQVNQVVTAVQGLATPPLNAQQIASVRAEVSKPNQQLVTPGAQSPATFFNRTGTNVMIGFDTGNVLQLGPQGQVISSGPFIPRIGISGWVAAMVIGEGAASVAVAIYLLVVGILVFRSYQKSPRLLGIYAALKIPLALLAGAGLSLMGYQFATSIASNNGMAGSAAPATFGFIIWGAVITVLGLAFPIGVLIALRTRTVRDYFNSVVM